MRLDQSILSAAFRVELVPQDLRDQRASKLFARIHTTRESTTKEKATTKKTGRPS